MDIFFGVTVSDKTSHLDNFFREVEGEIKALINQNSAYGNSLKFIYIGIFYVSPEYSQFFKVRKPKYCYENIDTGDGQVEKTAVRFEYEMLLDFEKYKDLSYDEAKLSFLEDLFNSMDVLGTDAVRKKFKDFPADQFIADSKNLFQLQ
ncbi:hypothetical protein [Pedobacter nutrimenti]|uniref:hypothetical protein n=1 Tax=Pedobacter nutrimenti TaxID=1241337 RepID=UPI00293145AB|nr:hypothetical protein [Pedobacter nutrimenti]